jgi:translation initiation factor IF-1
MDEAEAVTSFNAAGDGLVKLMVDGQVLQLLGSITPADRVAGVRIKAGDKVIIEAVDGARQRCTVSRRDKA